jgi:hypothetical protein
MNKDLFMKIVQGVRVYDDYFKYKKDCTRKWGFTLVQKCAAALQCIAYGAPPDTVVDYLRMAESTSTVVSSSFLGSCGSVWFNLSATTK